MVNVILFGRSPVDLAHVRLMQYAENESPLAGLDHHDRGALRSLD